MAGGEKEIHDINQIFFHNNPDLSVLESGRSADICVPLSPNMMSKGRSP